MFGSSIYLGSRLGVTVRGPTWYSGLPWVKNTKY